MTVDVLGGHRRTVIVAGALAQRPGVAGHAWMFLNWLHGLRSIGADVVFVDRLEPNMLDELDTDVRQSRQWRWLQDLLVDAGFGGRFALRFDGGRITLGMEPAALEHAVRNAVVVLDVMGYLADDEIFQGAPRVFIDIDPGFPQLWRKQMLHDAFDGYDAVVTVGLEVDRGGCVVGETGLPTVATLPPVSLEHWPMVDLPSCRPARVTTVATWRGPFAAIQHEGVRHGLRVHEFRRFFDLPRLIPAAQLEVALDIDPADHNDINALKEGGWTVADPRVVAACPTRYREYIEGSTAEFVVAKELYVLTRGGWFSDRSACYLASGRPVIAQETGFSAHLPTGAGLLSFTDPSSAADALTAVMGEPQRHARAARQLAAHYLNARKVIPQLFERLGITQR